MDPSEQKRMRLRFSLEARYEDGAVHRLNLELEGRRASVLLHLLSAMLYGDKEEMVSARVAWDMEQGKSFTRIAEDLGVTKKTLWLWRKFFELDAEPPQQLVRLRL